MGIESSIQAWLPCVLDEMLVCERERHNIHDPFAVVEQGSLEGSLMGPWGRANET